MDLLIPGFGLMIWTLIAFLVLLFILKKFAWKSILALLDEREHKINDSLETATKMKNEVANLKNENELLLAQAREEKASIIKDARQQAEVLISDAKNKAKIEFDKIVADAQQYIIQQKNAAIIDVKNQAGNIIIELSEKILMKELSQKEQQKSYIESLTKTIHFK
ncbi:MAG: F0F1 ATP synthase subunit B [Alphaproteobacteria bacterium]|nr:F0F1 ATP synthase subunit B [Alphaproteobacteria bacterium]